MFWLRIMFDLIHLPGVSLKWVVKLKETFYKYMNGVWTKFSEKQLLWCTAFGY